MTLHSTATRTNNVAELFALAGLGRATLLPVPAIVGRAETRIVLEQDPVIAGVLALGRGRPGDLLRARQRDAGQRAGAVGLHHGGRHRAAAQGRRGRRRARPLHRCEQAVRSPMRRSMARTIGFDLDALRARRRCRSGSRSGIRQACRRAGQPARRASSTCWSPTSRRRSPPWRRADGRLACGRNRRAGTVVLEVHHAAKIFPGNVVAVEDASLEIRRRRGALPAGRQRGRQEHAAEDHRRRQHAHPRQHDARRRACRFRSPHEAAAAGISMIYQELDLVPQLTVAQNMLLGRVPRRWGLVDHRSRTRASRGGPGPGRRAVLPSAPWSAACRSPTSSSPRSPAR